mgnify:CR=1 FL=1
MEEDEQAKLDAGTGKKIRLGAGGRKGRKGPGEGTLKVTYSRCRDGHWLDLEMGGEGMAWFSTSNEKIQRFLDALAGCIGEDFPTMEQIIRGCGGGKEQAAEAEGISVSSSTGRGEVMGQHESTISFEPGSSAAVNVGMRKVLSRAELDPNIAEWGMVFSSDREGKELCPSCGAYGAIEAEEWKGEVRKRIIGHWCNWCGWTAAGAEESAREGSV